MKWTAVALLLLAQDPLRLEHKAKRGQSIDCHQIVQFGIELKGDEEWVDKIKALSPLLSIQNCIIDSEATHEVIKAPKDEPALWRVKHLKGRVHGTYNDEAFEYNFAADRKVEPGDDKLKAMMYTLFAGGRTHALSKLGAMEDKGDPNKDPNGEGLDLIVYPIPRFQDKAIQAGDRWTEEWLSRTKDKESGHRIKFRQTVSVEKIDGAVAILKVVLAGEMQKPAGAKGNTESVTPKGEASVQFDIEKGQVVGYDSTGSVDIHFKGTDPNSTDVYDVHLILKGHGKMEAR